MKRADAHGQLRSRDGPTYREGTRVLATMRGKVGALAMTSAALAPCVVD
jgi:hypothetical protein